MAEPLGLLDIFSPQEDNGLLDPRRAAAAGLFAGLTNFGAQLAAAGAPRVGQPGPGWGGGLAAAGPAFTQGYNDAQQNYLRNGMLNQQVQRQANAQRIIRDNPNAIPESLRPFAGAIEPNQLFGAIIDQAKRQENARLLSQAMGALTGETPASTPSAPSAPSAPSGGGGGYYDRLRAQESGGNPNAASTTSSARGPDQFINGTWLNFANANPDLFQGMSREQILAARSDPALSTRATQWYAAENARALQQAGLPVNDATVALGHGFGAGGAAALLRADPSKPVDQVFGADVMNANPWLRGKTAGQVVGNFQMRYGNGNSWQASGGAAPAAQGVPAQANGAPAAIPVNRAGIDPQRLMQIAPMLAGIEGGPALLQTLAPLARQNSEPMVVGPGQYIYGPDRRLIGQTPQLPPQEDARMVRYRQLLEMPQRSQAQETELQTLQRAIGPEPSSQNVTVSADRTAQDRLSEGAITRINELRTAATTAVDQVQSSQRVLDILKSNAGAITGTGAEWRNATYRLLATAGVIDPERVANTDQLAAELANSALAQIRRLPGPASENDRRFIERVAAGSISLTPQVIERVARLNIEYGQRAVSEYNSIITPIHEDPRTSPVVRSAYGRIDLPAAPAAPRQTGTQPLPPPEVGTVREGYRFRGGDPSRRENWEQVR